MTRALRRLFVVLGVIHVVDGLVMAWLWRHRRTVLRLLAGAVWEELQPRSSGPAAGEGAAGPPTSSAGRGRRRERPRNQGDY